MPKYIRLETTVHITRLEEWKIPIENFSDIEISEIIKELTDDPGELWSYDPLIAYSEDADFSPVEITAMEVCDA